MMRDVIYWRLTDIRSIDAIRERFGIPRHMTVNGETTLPDGFDIDAPELREVERRGWISLRRKDIAHTYRDGCIIVD